MTANAPKQSLANKQDMIDEIAVTCELTKKDASTVVDVFLDALTKFMVEKGGIQFAGFGTFSVGVRATRSGFNPKTREKIEIPETRVVSFRAGKMTKVAVNGEAAPKAAPKKVGAAKKAAAPAKKKK